MSLTQMLLREVRGRSGNVIVHLQEDSALKMCGIASPLPHKKSVCGLRRKSQKKRFKRFIPMNDINEKQVSKTKNPYTSCVPA
jgi:aspartate carbamoyltransferase regulatory subunit